MRKIIAIIILIFAFIVAPITFAYDLDKNSYIYIGGQAVGIKLDCGVNVVGTYGIYTNVEIKKPWENIIYENDKIVSYNDNEINNYSDLVKALKKSNGNEAKVQLIRNNNIVNCLITPVIDNNTYSLGLYIKDSILGVGTLTYYIKEASIYVCLGHQIGTDELSKGQIYEAKVDSIVYPKRNQAGEKKATIYKKAIGEVKSNN